MKAAGELAQKRFKSQKKTSPILVYPPFQVDEYAYAYIFGGGPEHVSWFVQLLLC